MTRFQLSVLRAAQGYAAVLVVAGSTATVAAFACADSPNDTPKNTERRTPPIAPVKDNPYQWRNVPIVGGGFVSGIITHPRQKGLMYARTDIGGAYRWKATNARWEAITDWVSGANWTYTGIESLAVDPSDPNRVYIAAGTYTNDWSGNGAILRSNNQGQTWERTEMPFKMGGNEDGRSMGERLAVDPNDGRVLFFGSRHNGLWKSGDRGATWQNVASFPAQATENRLGVVGVAWVIFATRTGKTGAPTPTLYAGTGDKNAPLLRSDNGGVSWQTVRGQPTGLLAHHAVLDRDGTLYLSYSNGPGPNGVSDGAVWKQNTQSGLWTNITPEKGGFGYAGLSVDAQRPGTLIVSTLDRWAKKDTLFRSTDGGTTWKDLSPQSVRDTTAAPFLTWGRDHAELGHWIGDVEIDPFDSGHVIYDTGMGVWASYDAAAADENLPTHWTAAAALGIEECVVNEVVSPPLGAPVLSVLWDIDGFRHDNLQESPRTGFFKPSHGRNTGIDFAEHAPEIVARVYGGGTGGAYSLDNGRTWTEFVGSLTKDSNGRTPGNGTVAVSADGAVLVRSPENSAVVFSRDKGASWTPSAGVPSGARVVSDREDAAQFYAFDRTTGSVLVSTNGGATFAARATNLPKGDGFLRTVPGQKGQLWLGTGQGLFRSRDGGMTFAAAAPIQSAGKVGFGKAAPNRTYPAVYLVGTMNGVYGFFRSDDEGRQWERINDDGHQFGSINSITGDPRIYGRVYLGSANRGVLMGEINPHTGTTTAHR